MKVFTAEQMREFDRAAVEEYGIPSIVLMENAALRVVEFLEAKFAPLSEKKIVILCGKGNNGGDGLAIARHLMQVRVNRLSIYQLFGEDELKGDALKQAQMLSEVWQHKRPVYERTMAWPSGTRTFGCWAKDIEDNPTAYLASADVSSTQRDVMNADIVLDCVLGTGFRAPLHDVRIRAALHMLEGTYGHHVVAVDIPTALNSETGEQTYSDEDEPWIDSYSATITFAAPKRGFFVRDGLTKCGEVWTGDIGTSAVQMAEAKTGVQTLDLETAKGILPRRSLDAHKGDAGRLLILGGSFGMSGSIALSARSALHIGAGLCTAALPERILPTFAASCLEATSHPLQCDERGALLERAADELPNLWENMNAVALGPGLSRSDEAFAFVRRVVRECPVPLVIDADALHALPAIANEVKAREFATILTPHPGEMGELMGISAQEVNDDRFSVVKACAEKYGAITVLKGARTLVAEPDGEIWVNLTGHPGMATGGSGDVLTGTIAGLLAQTQSALSATQLGVYTHGLAGEIAARTLGNGLIAGDIANSLPLALREIETREVERINGRLRKLE